MITKLASTVTHVWLAVVLAQGLAVAGGQVAPPDPQLPRFDVSLGPAPVIVDPRDWETSAIGPVRAGLSAVDSANRQSVVDFYTSVYVPALAVANDWTGSASTCTAGATSRAYVTATLDMVNYFRAMTGLAASISDEAVKNGKSQQAALMMTANSALSHSPPGTWSCYSADGAEAAGKSNLALGMAGARAITGYMEDPGTNNKALGHRRWILYPRQTQMGTGSTGNANALWVIGSFGARPTTPSFVAWPPAGFVPRQVVYPRWSFSVNTDASVDLSGATVAMTRGGVSVPLVILPNAVGYGDNTIAWEPTGLSFGAGQPDAVVTVLVNGVLVGGVSKDYSYTVTVVDPVTTSCSYVISPESWSVPVGGATSSVAVTTSPTCAWTAQVASGQPWLEIVGAPGGTGTGAVSVRAAANSGGARTGSLMVAGRTVTVSQPAAGFTLRVTKAGTGWGTVTSDVAGISCDEACASQSASYPPGTRVTLTALAAQGASFAGWSGHGCFGTGTCSVTMSDAASVTATFTADPGSVSYYLAEGATGAFFDYDLAIANPNDTQAPVVLTFLKDDGTTVIVNRTLAPMSRTTIPVESVPGLELTAVSAVVTSTTGLPLAVERTMTWDQTGYGAHTEKATPGAALTWYFAEGSEQAFFDTYLLLANPQPSANRATVQFLIEGAAPITRVYDLLPTSRTNVFAEAIEDPAGTRVLRDRAFGIVVTFDLAGVAERAMYFGSTPFWNGGHESAGVNQPSTSWFLAEGATGAFFDTFVLLSNPNAAAATVTLRFLLDSGATVTKQKTVAANGRVTVGVEGEDALLAEAAVATQVTSDRPIVVERAMYWTQYPNWYEAHNAFGVTGTASRWVLGEGRVGGANAHETYVLLANPGTEAATVTVTYLREGGLAPVVRTHTVQGTSRYNVVPSLDGLANERFGALIESTQPIVVERAMYSLSSSQPGLFWAAGTGATGTPLP
jgi:hypothetical protein